MNYISSKIRFPVLAFPIAGLVAAVTALTPGIGISPEHDPAGFARAANLVGLANLAGLIAFVLLLFGFEALYGFLADSSAGRWALAGMMFSVAGAALFASFLGILAFVAPIAGRMYLNGQMQAIGVI